MCNEGDWYVRAEMQIAEISRVIDRHNAHRDSEAILWGRVAKVAEEAGEAVSELVAHTGQNPRKRYPDERTGGPTGKLVKELLDAAIAALGAVEHLSGNQGRSIKKLFVHISDVNQRLMVEGPR